MSTFATRASGGIGRRAGFRCLCPSGRGGSSPPSPTVKVQVRGGFRNPLRPPLLPNFYRCTCNHLCNYLPGRRDARLSRPSPLGNRGQERQNEAGRGRSAVWIAASALSARAVDNLTRGVDAVRGNALAGFIAAADVLRARVRLCERGPREPVVSAYILPIANAFASRLRVEHPVCAASALLGHRPALTFLHDLDLVGSGSDSLGATEVDA